MPWPTPQDYNEAIQNPQICFADDELKGSRLAVNALGLPQVTSGNFCSVYKITTGSKDWAIRCFTRAIVDQQARYDLLSDFITSDDLIYTVSFEFQLHGMRIGRHYYPVVKMEWVNGEHFIPWIEANLAKPERLIALAERLSEMVAKMQDCGIAHGDLQHGNILIVDEDIRLVDYDGMFVPDMLGMQSNELGHPNYQHPARDPFHFGPYLDNFSGWLIYVCLQMLARDADLWKLCGAGFDQLLFKESDLRYPDSSPAFRLIEENDDRDVRNAGATLRELLLLSPEQVPPLALGLDELKFQPIKTRTWLERTRKRVRFLWYDKLAPMLTRRSNASDENENNKQRAVPTKRRNLGTPEWLREWIHANPQPSAPGETADKQFEEATKTTSTIQPGLPAKVDELVADAFGPSRLKPHEIKRLLVQAKERASAYRFDDANRLMEASLHASFSALPSVQANVLRTLADIDALNADWHVHERRTKAAIAFYEKAIATMIDLRNMRHGAPDRDDDLMLARLFESIAEVYWTKQYASKAADSLKRAIEILSTYPGHHHQAQRLQRRIESMKATR